MNKNFTYIIRSKDREVQADNTNSCTIKLYGLPQQYRYFNCEVSALHVSTTGLANFTTSTFELRADGIDIENGWDTNNKRNTSVGFASFNNTYPQGSYTFTCANFNGRSVRFQLYGDNNALLTTNNGANQYNAPWFLILNMTGIEEDRFD
jgi:hypothetical protein